MTVQYLIDSENVGDFWIPLLDLPAEETELIVFYTRNSPHMSYDSLIRLKESNRTVTFIKCYEGTNALDFQLVSELGYRICENEEDRFVIVTNDTGYDAAVKYWRRRKKSVKRITGKEAKNPERRIREDLKSGHAQAGTQAEEAAVPVRRYTAVEHDAEHDAHVDAYHAEVSRDPDGRPSRSNLRDVESASLPEAEETPETAQDSFAREYSEESHPGMEEDDFGMDVYEPEDEDLNDSYTGEAETDLPSLEEQESEWIPGQEQSTRAYTDMWTGWEQAPAGQMELFETELSGEPVPGTDPYEEPGAEEPFSGSFWERVRDEEPASVSDAQPEGPGRSGSFSVEETPISGEASESGEAPAALKMPEPEAAPADAEIPEAEEATAVTEVPLPEEAPAVTGMSAQEETPADAELPGREEVPEISVSPETGADPDLEEAASEIGRENPDPVSADPEEQGRMETAEDDENAEPAHRTRSRRSRSRRSRSSSKRQEESAEADAKQETGSAGKASEEPAAGHHSGDRTKAETDEQNSAPARPFDPSMPPGDEEIARIVACIGAENLAELHNQLATFYGDQGKDIYLSIKNNNRSLPVLNPDLSQKFTYYCEIIFARSEPAEEYPPDISEFLLSVREKLNNLNSLRYALQKHYGKEKGRRYYFLLKPFAKTMYQM